MNSDAWLVVLAAALVVNAVLGFGYRVHRLTKGGPSSDVLGQALLGALLIAVAVAAGTGAGWARWPALVYALVFGVVVMPVWVLAVLIPLPPERIDYAFTIVYWVGLAVVAVTAIAA